MRQLEPQTFAPMADFFLDEFDSPVGRLLAIATPAGDLKALEFIDAPGRIERVLPPGEPHRGQDPLDLHHRLRRYFHHGDRDAFAGLSLAPRGTAFQQRVWSELRRIAWGETLSYAQVAERIGSPKSVRAVGLANGANPIAIIVPCHRVIGSNGSLTGYGGGLDRKYWLLVHEGALLL